MDVSGRSLGLSTFSTMISQTSDNTVYIIGGAEHSSITRVDGLSSITRLTPFTVTVDSTKHTGSANWQITREQERQAYGSGRKTLTLQPYPFPLPIDGNTGEYRNWVEVYNWYPGTGLAGSVSAAVGYDDATLYCALNGGDLTNSASDMAHLFRTGGGIVLELGTSASNPTRTAAQAGDIRLVVARTSGGITKAMLYKQVATGGTSHTYTNGVRSVTMQDVQDGLDPLQHLILSSPMFFAHDAGIHQNLPSRITPAHTYATPDHPLLQYLEANPHITAILAPNDPVAHWAWAMIESSGRRVPDDISIIGFDDTDPMTDITGENLLTSVRLPLVDVGRRAAQLLLDRISGKAATDEHLILPTALVVRCSTGPSHR